jgi:hypothetical protein
MGELVNEQVQTKTQTIDMDEEERGGRELEHNNSQHIDIKGIIMIM